MAKCNNKKINLKKFYCIKLKEKKDIEFCCQVYDSNKYLRI